MLPWSSRLQMIPQDLFINLTHLLVIKSFPSHNFLHTCPWFFSLLKFSQYNPCSPWPPRFSIAMITKSTTITKPYSIQVSTEVISVIMAYEHGLHISHGDKGLQDRWVYPRTSYTLLKLAYYLFVKQLPNFWDRNVEKCKCRWCNWGSSMIGRMKRILLLCLSVCDLQDVNGMRKLENLTQGKRKIISYK